jgi:uncharacterized membrane protein
MPLCNICFENKNTIILPHINSIGDISGHKMCENCYKNMTTNTCPFCRCDIKSYFYLNAVGIGFAGISLVVVGAGIGILFMNKFWIFSKVYNFLVTYVFSISKKN